MIAAILIFSVVFICAVGGTLYIAHVLEKENQ
jgi:hypothetical protein